MASGDLAAHRLSGMKARMKCRICDGATEVVGQKHGSFARRDFTLRRCVECRFAFVDHPWLDFAKIYDDDYYRGRGADPLVDYRFELTTPARTVRRYEWAGVVDVVRRLTTVDERTRWLDFGCGSGGLVRHAREVLKCDAVGFEEGAIASAARASGIPVLDAAALASRAGSFDVVTAIEVLEHVVDPLETLTKVRRLLRPGGLFFYTTGNARPFRDRLLEWRYFVPEIHISLYEPESMEQALIRTGFQPQFPGRVRGWDKIIAFKVLKNLGAKTLSPLDRIVPWRLASAVVGRRFGIYDFPVGWAS
jgi:2-polyprenyl-3-methyl-5-hydroxy-6-metoxy-1,4-benzoquinol methylase